MTEEPLELRDCPWQNPDGTCGAPSARAHDLCPWADSAGFCTRQIPTWRKRAAAVSKVRRLSVIILCVIIAAGSAYFAGFFTAVYLLADKYESARLQLQATQESVDDGLKQQIGELTQQLAKRATIGDETAKDAKAAAVDAKAAAKDARAAAAGVKPVTGAVVKSINKAVDDANKAAKAKP